MGKADLSSLPKHFGLVWFFKKEVLANISVKDKKKTETTFCNFYV